MKLKVRCPNGLEAERSYILNVLLGEFLGIDFDLEFYNPQAQEDARVEFSDGISEKMLTVADVFFAESMERWLSATTIPKRVFANWDCAGEKFRDVLSQSDLPVIFGRGQQEASFYWEIHPGFIHISADLIGSSFFMLTLYEEAIVKEKDEHGRFPERASLAQREKFINRPVVNEYLEVLWFALSALWPELPRKSRAYQIFVSHDVDVPFGAVGVPGRVFLRGLGGDVLVRKCPSLAMRRLAARITKMATADPFFNFSWICQQSEQRGLRSAFYFICGGNNPLFDPWYRVDDIEIRDLIHNLVVRGHEVGLHPSYDTFQSAEKIREELAQFRQVAKFLGLPAQEIGGRQHWLRWSCPDTWQLWEDAGLAYDSSIGYAENIGFRAGTCYDFPVFNLRRRCQLELRERPLIVMDVALVYQKKPKHRVIANVVELIDRCRKYRGTFSLLWHNHILITEREQDLYLNVLNEAVRHI